MLDNLAGTMVRTAVLLLLVMAPAVAHAQTPEWNPLHLSSRTAHAMAYDSRRGVTVLFGGVISTTSGDTWEWDASAEKGAGSWTLRDVDGPSARQSHAMAYDSARGVTVLFGGQIRGSSAFSGETWEWNGTQWTLRIVSGPSARFGHAMVYDSARGVTVLFGGIVEGGSSSAQCWEWDGAQWSVRAVSGPSATSSHAMAFDSGRHVTVLYDGSIGAEETWEWNGVEWTQRMVTGPFTRAAHAMAYDPVREVTVLYGGGQSTFSFDDTWEWNGDAWTQRVVTGPDRRGHDMVYDTARNVLVSFGGSDSMGVIHAETWELSSDGQEPWTQRTPTAPPGRYGHSMTYDAARGVGVLFGGQLGIGEYDGQTWEWHAPSPENGSVSGEWVQREVAGPEPSAFFAMAYDTARKVTVLFGGRGPGFISGQTWEWNGTEWTRRLISGPSPRRGHAMAYDSVRGVIVLFGGLEDFDGRTFLADTWEYDGTAWTHRGTAGPPDFWGRATHAMAYDSARAVTVLFGGLTGINMYDNQTWEWDGATWTRRLVSGPTHRAGHSMAYDTARGVTVLYGGIGSVVTSETWEWDGTAWIGRNLAGPLDRSYHAMFYDDRRDTTVLFSGLGSISQAPGRDTWGLGTPCAGLPLINTHPIDQDTCVGGSAEFGVSVTGRGPLSYQWRRDKQDLADEPGHISGARSPTLVILEAVPDDEGVYDCVATDDCGSITSNSAMLSICAADFNCDAAVNSQDFFDFLTAFFASSPDADFNADKVVNSQDFFDFLTAFFDGC